MNFLRQWAKSINEANKGKIYTYPTGWVFSDQGCTNAQGVYLGPQLNAATGKMISLQIQKFAGNCPIPPDGMAAVPQDRPSNTYWVPYKKCLKCPYHLRRHNRATGYCRALRDRYLGSPSGQAEVLKQVALAQEKALEILK